jgi:hypothetical protein
MNDHSQQLQTFTAKYLPCQLLYHCLKPLVTGIFPSISHSVLRVLKALPGSIRRGQFSMLQHRLIFGAGHPAWAEQ